jgi:hypothetical protein
VAVSSDRTGEAAAVFFNSEHRRVDGALRGGRRARGAAATVATALARRAGESPHADA